MAAKRFPLSPGLRFSIRQLLLGTALVAVACVALRSASSLWVAALLGLVLLALAGAVPLVLFCQRDKRAWWFGFAFFGWLYMLLLAYSWSLDPNTSLANPLRPYSLITTRVSNLGYEKIYGGTGQPAGYQQVVQQVATTAYVNTLVPGVVSPNPYASVGGAPSGVFSYVPVTTYMAVTNPTVTGPALDDFVNVAHAFWTVLLAVGGGWFTCWLYQRSKKQEPIAAASDSTP